MLAHSGLQASHLAVAAADDDDSKQVVWLKRPETSQQQQCDGAHDKGLKFTSAFVGLQAIRPFLSLFLVCTAHQLTGEASSEV